MKKLVAVFLVAVLGPTLVLAWLAMRSVRDQEIVVHSQRALLHQGATDALAADLNTLMDGVREYFGTLVDQLAQEYESDQLTRNFHDLVPGKWPQASLSCAISDSGELYCPPVDSPDPRIQAFLDNNLDFLTNGARVEVYRARESSPNPIAIQETRTEEPEAFKKIASRFEEPPAANAKAAIDEVETRAEPFSTVTGLAAARQSESQPQPQGAASPEGDPEAPPAPETTTAPPSGKVFYQQKVTLSQEKLRSIPRVQGLQQQRTQQPGEAQQQVELPGASQSEQPFPIDPQTIQAEAFPAGGEIALADSGNQAGVQSVRQDEEAFSNGRRIRNVQPFGQIGQGAALAANGALGDNPNAAPWSNLEADWGNLRQIMGDDPEGAISRFLEDGLHVLLWRRHPEIPATVFWTELDLEVIKEDFANIVRQVGEATPDPEISLALLDSKSQVVAQTVSGFSADWRQPFVASEVGEILPHWEVAAYLLDPEAVNRSANLARLTLRLLVPGLLIAIGLGAVLIFAEIGREMRLARQKTDFVSNVSHELKTPLTSIRMFSDLLSTPRQVESEKRTEYSGIISREAARLTRLINNLLDFSRLERNEKKYQLEKLDAVSLARETVENYRHQIEKDGFTLRFHDLSGGTIPIRGDRDSLSQVILNLLSNAEKYGGENGEIDVEVAVESRSDGDRAEIRILDRGSGIARKHAAKVFEKFFRVDDSLSSGIEGSGLGLTLARQIARAHGGDVIYRPREGGGSCFALALPAAEDND